MKDQVTKFDLVAAFKALDEIEIPKVKGMRANRMDLSESTKRIDRTSMLVEDYYDLSNSAEVNKAGEERDAEIAQAKLARIEKIVDLNAKSPEDLLPSYAGKAIIQCPQCMNIFFKEPSDIEGAEGDIKTVHIGDTVNDGEICQHCGNDNGYIFGGWVEAEQPESAEEPAEEAETELEPVELTSEEASAEETELEEIPEEEFNFEEPTEEGKEESEGEEEKEEPEEEPEEEKKEESFRQTTGKALKESVSSELNRKLKNFTDYITELQREIELEEQAAASAKNDLIKKIHEETADNLKAKLEKALPEEIKLENELLDADEVPEDAIEEIPEEPKEKTEESYKVLKESRLVEGSSSDVDKLLNSAEFKNPISDEEVRSYLNDSKNEAINLEELENEEFDEKSFNKQITEYLTKVYKNVKCFEATNCAIEGNKLIIEGKINFKSGKVNKTLFEFYNPTTTGNTIRLAGKNKELAGHTCSFMLSCKRNKKGIVTESLDYRYKINESLISGSTKR